MGVIEAPRVQLTNGLFRTIEKPTSLPTAATEYPSRRSAQSFNQGGRRKAGVELTRNREHSVRGSPLCHTRESGYPAGRDAAAQGLRLAGGASRRNSVSVVVSWMPAFAGMTRG